MLLGFDPGAVNQTGSANDMWGLGDLGLGGVTDVFVDWGKKVADLDIYKRSLKAGLVPTAGNATFSTGGGAAGVDDSFSGTDYQKIGMWIGVAGLVIAALAFMRGR